MVYAARLDVEATLAVLRLALAFDWTWDASDVARFAGAAGWQPRDLGDETTIFMTTGASIDSPSAWFDLDNGVIQEITVQATDRVDPTQQEFLSDAFATSSARVAEVLGAATRVSPGRRPGLQWERPEIHVELMQLDRSVALTLLNPAHETY
ncbi:hypothetical protein D5S18_17150 [Nocardia panacis]|uniref:Uncharacterized protein n=1 Tax=Nocardia panacis TaxID=2340916 RepID=A0A3A4KJL9_9NOCA|nr:DUF6301 family protein [Nocardia panacis]RJO75102.1 hypothetical protein D5S18_17150 [Nocardia panacis]